MTGEEWAAIIDSASDAGLVWYSTVTQKPVATRPPGSAMEVLVGTDYGSAPGSGAGIASGVLILAVVIVVAVVVMRS